MRHPSEPGAQATGPNSPRWRLALGLDERRYGPRPLSAPLEGAAESEAHIHLREEISRLPPNFKDAYVLCSVRGLSYDEAGAICGCPAKTISTRLARARKQLVKRMEKWL